MKVALIMPPLTSAGPGSNSAFRFLHDLARGRPFWNPWIYPLVRRFGLVDFDFYPSNLVQLGTMLAPTHQVRIFNFLLRDLEADVLAWRPEVLGFACPGGGNLLWIERKAKAWKARLRAAVVLGGVHVGLDPERSLLTTCADVVCRGEVDLVLPQVLDHLAGRNAAMPAEGVCYRRDGSVVLTPPAQVGDLGQLPVPKHELVDLAEYRSIGIEFSRGCPHLCDFCYLSGFERRVVWRYRPVARILEEIDHLAGMVPQGAATRLYFLDANVGGQEERLQDLLTGLIASRRKFPFWTGTTVGVSDKTLALLAEAGCSFLYTGLETGSVRQLAAIPKLGKLSRVERFIEAAADHGLSVSFNLMLLQPGETRADLAETLTLCRRLALRGRRGLGRRMGVSFYPHLFRPVPGTPLLARLVKDGWRPPSDFTAWGRFYEDLANGRLGGANFTADVRAKDLHQALSTLFLLNLGQVLGPGLSARILTGAAHALAARSTSALGS